MDGILSGLTSIVPILPDQSMIVDRSGANGPPVEIMPLPADSFMSDDAATEFVNNSFSFSLDKDGRGSGAAGGENTVGNTASRSGWTAPDTRLADGMLEEAYTLTLGNEEGSPVDVEVALEMSRMKSYEMLGKSASRRPPRRTPEEDNTGHAPAPSQDEGSAGPISGKDRSLLYRLTAQQNETGAQLPAQSEAEETIIQAPEAEAFLVPPEALPEADGGPRQTPRSGEAAAAAVEQQDLSLLTNLRGIQLSASDIEAILTLEPELREALLNMLSDVSSGSSAAPEDIAVFIAGTETTQPQTGGVQESAYDIQEAPDTAPAARPGNIPDDPRAAPLSDEELLRLTSEVLAGGKTRAAAQTSSLKGSMVNLRKANELPYSLYLFGSMSAKRKEEADDTFESDAPDEAGVMNKQTGKYLRLSEAIKMACVLHEIYYGGSGRFPEETPWYTPYVRYAIKNGIIQSGEFGDYLDYATRAETAYIFSNCVPKAEFPIINYLPDIPDVIESTVYGGAVYLLFRAGVLKKNGSDPRFHPESMITISEAASIIGRIATPEDRKLFKGNEAG